MADIIIHSTLTEREQVLDTPLRCPSCNGDAVMSRAAQTGHRYAGEQKEFVPRQQDRWCVACGHRWMAILPPAFVSLQVVSR